MKLIYQMMLAALLGLIVGNFISPGLIASIAPLGDIYMHLLKTIALPLIFFSLISGMISLSHTKVLYKVGFKSIAAFLLTGLIASLIGIASSFIFLTHQRSILLENIPILSSTALSLKGFLSFIIPTNFLGSFTGDSTIQVTLLAILIAIGVLTLPHKEKKVVGLVVQATSKLFLNIIEKIMVLSPLTVLIFTANLVAQFERKVFTMLIGFVTTLVIAYMVQYLFLGLYIRFVSKLPPLPFFLKSLKYQLIALSTGSSKATLPYTIQVARNEMGISKEKASFVLPLGATINMDGLSIYLSLAILFVAHMTGVVFTWEDYILLIFASSLMAIGTAGIPGGALALLPILFSIWHLPYEYIPLFIAIDPLINLLRSTLNITGDVAVTLILDKLHNGLEVEKYKTREVS